MSKRRLSRQLSLPQVIMLGAAGTIAAEIFVLTGHAAGIAGPAAVLALLLAGLLSYSIALNYCELATTFPVTGGALTYVREAWGANLLSFLVGSLDCLSSTFYTALSAVGFAYSLRIFIPALPIIPTAILIIGLFTLLNILGVNNVGNAQIVLGGVLMVFLGGYIILGLTLRGGFSWETFTAGEGIFIHRGIGTNIAKLMATIALVYNAYVGFEVIADDAEEIRDPNRNIPLGLLISLTLTTIFYVLVALVTIGTVPWQELAGSEVALAMAAQRFMPGAGKLLIAIAGIIATLTSVNTALLSATREAFTMSRDGAWPRIMARLSRFRTPYVSVLVIGAISALIAVIGLVDFLSYISSSGYLFVLFWSNLAMVQLRRRYPSMNRPFRVPLFPLTAYLAAASCFLIIIFTQWQALLFGAGVIGVCTVFYYLRAPVAKMVAVGVKTMEPPQNNIMVPVANPHTAEGLVHLATILARQEENTSLCILNILVASRRMTRETVEPFLDRLETHWREQLGQVIAAAQACNVPLYTKTRIAPSAARGVLDEIIEHNHVQLLLMGWPGHLSPQALAEHPVKVAIMKARTNVAVLLNRNLRTIQHILVPVGGGTHSRLAIRLAYALAEQENAELTAITIFAQDTPVEMIEDKMLLLREIIETELGSVPVSITTRVAQAHSVPEGILAETTRGKYDLVVMGASEHWVSRTRLFGSANDWVAEQVPCSALLVRRYESVAISWVRRQAKRIED